MKKLLIMVLAVLMTVALFAACTPEPAAPADVVDEVVDDAEEVVDEVVDEVVEEVDEVVEEVSGYEIAMITDKGDIDDKSFNQGTWEGVVEFAEANGITHKYYKPTEVSDDAYLAAIDLAIIGGAKVIVAPGFLFTGAIFQAQDIYPEIKFVLIDGFPNDGNWGAEGGPEFRIEDNVYSVIFKEEQVGFLAGAAAVKEGFTKLGYLGGQAVPAVVRYGYGFVQGAEYMAAQMGIDSIEIQYFYTGDFAATPENQAKAAAWFAGGTECIFAAGGSVGSSAMAAAEAAGGKVIGVDVDQSGDSPTVITSAMKGLGFMVQGGLAGYMADDFRGGISDIVGLAEDALGLEMGNARFENFTQADYDAFKADLVADKDGVASAILNDTLGTSPEDIAVSIVNLVYDN